MPVPDLELLRSFISVVDAGSFTRAGERVHRTQSTVSQQIQRLEEQFGRPLLHRTGRRVTPTDDGERLLPYARRLLALADETREAMAQSEGLGILRLGIPEDFAARRLSELLSRFFRTHPQLRYDVRCELSVTGYRARPARPCRAEARCWRGHRAGELAGEPALGDEPSSPHLMADESDALGRLPPRVPVSQPGHPRAGIA